MTKLSENKKKALEKKGWKSATVAEFLDLTTEQSEQIEVRLLVLEKFPTAEIIESTSEKIEFLLPCADENLQQHITKIFNLGNCKFSLTERNKDWKIRVVLSK
jgi:hypothetical protein